MTTNYHDPLLSTDAANASNINSRLSELDAAISGFQDGTNAFNQINLGTAFTVTISAGEVVALASNLKIDTEGATASDDLDTIRGGTDGMLIIVSAANAARDVVLKHGTGNIQMRNGADYTLDTADKALILVYVSGNWVDASGESYESSGARAYVNSALNIPTASSTMVAFDTEAYDTDGYWNSGDATKLVVPTNGRYLIVGNVSFPSGGGTLRFAKIFINGSTVIGSHHVAPVSGAETAVNVSALAVLNAGDYVTLQVYQDSGGNLDVQAYYTALAVERMVKL